MRWFKKYRHRHGQLFTNSEGRLSLELPGGSFTDPLRLALSEGARRMGRHGFWHVTAQCRVCPF